MVGFRVDANEKIATGHLMRCMAIAAECRKKGEKCLFLMAEDKESSRLREREFTYEILHTRWDAMEEELPIMWDVISRERLEWLVVDSYQATPHYLSKLNQRVPVMYIDDLSQEKYQVSALLHYGLCPDMEEYQHRYGDTKTKILAGMEYIPLREEFSLRRDFQGENSVEDREKSILITTGGTDTYNITGKLLERCLAHQEFSEYQYHVIVGSMNEHAESLQRQASEHCQIYLHRNVTNISDYMRRCQLAVSAGGTTLFELCACGIPTICFSFADNQKPGTIGMGSRDIMQYAGDARETDVAESILEGLLRLIQSRTLRQEYAGRMKRLVDGCGAGRIADILCRPFTIL